MRLRPSSAWYSSINLTNKTSPDKIANKTGRESGLNLSTRAAAPSQKYIRGWDLG